MALFYAALAWLAGIGLARWGVPALEVQCPLPGWLWLLPLACLPLTPLLDRLRPVHPPTMVWPVWAGFEPPHQPPRPALGGVLLLCLLAGALRYAGQPLAHCWTAADLAYFNLPATAAFDRSTPTFTLTGYVAGYPEVNDARQRLVVAAQTLRNVTQVQPVRGSVLLTTASSVRYTYGQPLTVTGHLVAPGTIDGFDYAQYLAVRGIYSVMYGAEVQALAQPLQGNPALRLLYPVRARGEALLQRLLPEPYAALANGMLLGIDSGIPDALDEQFKTTGASHVLVISGTNVALIAGTITAVAVRLLGRRRALWPALAGIAGYALLVGGEAAVLRAAVMGGLLATAAALDRRSTALVSLVVAWAAIVLANPPALWDVGLQLSSMATAGLILFSRPIARWIKRLLPDPVAWLRPVGEDVIATTLAATVATLPLMLYTFGRLSLVSLLTNLLIAPIQPLILFGGSAGLLVGLFGLEPLARVVLWLPWLGLAWTVAAVQATAALPGAALEVSHFGPVALAGSYLLLAALSLPRRWATHIGRWLASSAAIGAGGIAVALLWLAVLSLPDGKLHVWFLDVGQGDAILIQTPSGRQVLVDGGASGQALLGELGATMPFWDRDLDLLVLTHADGDHMAAQVEVPRRFGIASAWATATSQAETSASLWRSRLQQAGVPVQVQAAGGWADLGDGVELHVLGPPQPALPGKDAGNQNSLVARLVYGQFSVLLTGDAGTAAEAHLLAVQAPLTATVLKVGHHGSHSSTSAAFVQHVAPQLAVIQVGAGNRYGHPHDEVLDRLAGSEVLRTDEQGRIEVVSDGGNVWVKTEHQP